MGRGPPRPHRRAADPFGRLAAGTPFGQDAQKKTPRAAEQHRDDVALERWLFARLKPTLAPSRLVFVDESGVNLSMTRRYAWSVRGEPAYGAVPVNRGKNQTLIAAVSTEGGLIAPMQVEGATTGDVFVAYVEQVLAPQLRVGDVVCLDNLSAHRVAGVRAAVERAGASVLYLPRYSPEHNPVELLWAQVKRLLRTAAARTVDALDAAITAALRAVTVEEVRGWFRHCGYCA